MKKILYITFIYITFIYSSYGNTLKVAVSSNVGWLNPQGYAQNKMYAQSMVYEGLVKIDSKGDIIPSLAKKWDIDKTGKIYTFYLREGVRFSNGEVFDAHAVKKNFDSLLKNRVRHSWSNLALLIDSVQIIDTYKIQLILKKAYIPTLSELSLIRPYRFVAPSEIPADLDLVKHNPKPIGTGAYMLEKSILGVGDVFVKNPHYWDKDRYNGIYFSKIETKIIIEPNAKLLALRSGSVDMIYGYDEIPIEIFKQLDNKHGFLTYQSPAIFTSALVLNPANEFLDSINIRKAIAYSINKEAIIKAVYDNLQKSANYLFALNMPHADISHKCKNDISQNINHAKSLIESSGFKINQDGYYYKDNKRLSLALSYVGNNPAQKASAEILQYQLKSVGIELKLVPNEASIYHNRQRQGDFDLSFHQTWGMPYEPLIMLNSMRHLGHVDYIAQKPLANKSQIDKEIESVMLSSSKELDSKLHEILCKIYDTGIYIPITYETNKAVVSKDIKGVNLDMRAIEIPFWEFYK